MSPSLRPVPILETVTEVYRDFFQNIAYLPRLALLPFSLSFALLLLSYLSDSEGLRLLLDILEVGPIALFAFLWHRLLLYGPNPETLRALPPFDDAFRRFVLYTLMLLAPLLLMQEMMPPPPPPGSDPAVMQEQLRSQAGIMFFLLPLLIVYLVVMVGLSFLFPATAAGKRYGPRDAWRDANGIKFALFVMILLTLVPLQVAMWLVLVPVDLIGEALQLVAPSLLVFTLAKYIALPLSTGILTQAYKIRFGWTSPPPSTT